MKSHRNAVAAAALVYLFALSLHGQASEQMSIQPTTQTREQLTKALQAYRETKDRRGEALTLLQLGIMDAGSGSVSGARSNLIEAVEKMRTQNDFVGAWVGLVLLSQIEMATGRPADAVSHIEGALVALNEAKVSTAPFRLDTFLAVSPVSGVPPQMRQMLDDPHMAGVIKSMLIQYSFDPITHDVYGSALILTGQLEKAEAELKTAAAGTTQGLYDFSIELHFGDLRFQQQRYDEARTHYVKALNASSTTGATLSIGDQPIKASIYDRLVRLETIAGHPDEAKRWSEKARELVKNATRPR